MARPRTPSAVGLALAAAHKAAGSAPFIDVRDAVKEVLGPYTPTEQTLRTWHGPDAPRKLDPLVIATLADVYDVEVASLDPAMTQQLPRIKDLLVRSRWLASTAA